jgi:hypothetical protein
MGSQICALSLIGEVFLQSSVPDAAPATPCCPYSISMTATSVAHGRFIDPPAVQRFFFRPLFAARFILDWNE